MRFVNQRTKENVRYTVQQFGNCNQSADDAGEVTVHDGYIRGSMGGEEETSQARTVTSPEPLPDEIKKFRKLYILVPISLIIGILKGDFTGWLAIAAFILLCLVCLIDTYADHKVRRLRRMK